MGFSDSPKYLYRIFNKESKMFISLHNISYFSNLKILYYFLKEYHISLDDIKIIKYELKEIKEIEKVVNYDKTKEETT